MKRAGRIDRARLEEPEEGIAIIIGALRETQTGPRTLPVGGRRPGCFTISFHASHLLPIFEAPPRVLRGRSLTCARSLSHLVHTLVFVAFQLNISISNHGRAIY
jgi:hypothetical protein